MLLDGCRSGVGLLDVQGVVDEEAERLPQEAEEDPEGNVAQLTVVQVQVLREELLEGDGGRLHQHRQEGVVAHQPQRHAHQVLVGHRRQDEHQEVGAQLGPALLQQRRVAVADEEEVHGQVPSLPVLLQVAAVPPVHVEVAVAELDDLGDDVEQQVEEGVEPHDPPDCVGNRQPHQPVGYLHPLPLAAVRQRKPRLQLRLHVLHPQHQQQRTNHHELHHPLQQPRHTDGGRTRVLQLVAQRGRDQEVRQPLPSNEQLPVPAVLDDDLQVVGADLVVGEHELVELRTRQGRAAVQDRQHLAVHLHVTDQLQEQHQPQHSEAQPRNRVVLQEVLAVQPHVHQQRHLVHLQQHPHCGIRQNAVEAQTVQPVGQLHEEEEREEADGGAVGQELEGRLLEPGPVAIEVIDYVAKVQDDEHDSDKVDEPPVLLRWRLPGQDRHVTHAARREGETALVLTGGTQRCDILHALLGR